MQKINFNSFIPKIPVLIWSIVLLPVLWSYSSCKTVKPTKAEKENKNADTTATGRQTFTKNVDNEGNSIVDLYISFYSVASGIDYNARTGMLNFIQEFQEKHGVTIRYINIPWGREGEVDYCFDLSALNKTLQTEFSKGIKERLSVSDRVHIYENQSCSRENLLPRD